MMKQYLKLKSEVGDAILFYRMGDFYEMFFEDAQVAAEVCDLTLTSRNKSDPAPVPMAGVPWHSAQPHIVRLLQAGHRVAICEQVVNPENHRLMDRRIVEILTPGTAIGEGFLQDARNNFLLAVAPGRKRWGLAAADLSTGELLLGEVAGQEVGEELERFAPRELLTPREAAGAPQLRLFLQEHPGVFSAQLDDWHFSPGRGRKTLQEHYGVVSLEAYGIEDLTLGLAAGGALLTYAKEQRRGDLDYIRPPRALSQAAELILDESTLRNLEVLEPLSGEASHCLLKVLDQTRTALGARALRRALARPLIDVTVIRARHSAVASLCDDPSQLERMRGLLTGIADLERLLARLHAGRARGLDLSRLRDSLEPIEALLTIVTALGDGGAFRETIGLDPARELRAELTDALTADPGLSSAGAVIRDGYDAKLDEMRGLARGGREWIAQLQVRERERSGIPSLKVGYNKVFGYYIEVTRTHLARVPADYQRKQTLVGAERFITPELKEWEEKVLGAEQGAAEREETLVEELRQKVLRCTAKIQAIAAAVAEWDLLASFAQRAREARYVRPQMDESDHLEIIEGRHPVVERFMAGESFVPNDVDLNTGDRQVQIITGPNMAGKSTYLRQVGLLVLMAQAGSFIPAREARIGIADRIFTRVGASDRIARGQSTFLVEMVETSRILHAATSRSLVLLDEIGRGTSTFDGLAIAWAVAEHLRRHPRRRPRTLFATHFHELTELARRREGYRNLNVLVKEWKDQIIFVRRVSPGSTDRSYGIQVARLAGLPEEVLARAREVLSELEASGPRDLIRLAEGRPGSAIQFTLFGREGSAARSGPATPAVPQEALRELVEALGALDVDSLSPREAIDWLYRWKSRVKDGEGGASPPSNGGDR
jgi:DNA mismatch repair protein MutS